MTPLDFIKDSADNDHDTPAGKLIEALNSPLVILSAGGHKWNILSYYMYEEQMVIDIERDYSAD